MTIPKAERDPPLEPKPVYRQAIMLMGFEALAKIMRLPDGHTVEHVHEDLEKECVFMVCQGPSLPRVHPGDSLPRVRLMWMPDGTTMFLPLKAESN